MDMHDLGDALLHEGFIDPVLDVNYYVTNYCEQNKLRKELEASEMLEQSPSEWNTMMPAEDGTWDITYEVIYAHAFAPLPPSADEGIVKIPLTQLRKTLNSPKKA
jgi:malonyl-CoA O-methyltransferase